MKKQLPGGAPLARKTVTLSPGDLVTFEGMGEGALPLLARPSAEGVDLPAWAARNRDLLARHLQKHGGVLFRGFGMESIEDFGRFTEALQEDLLEYSFRSTPRTVVSGRIYTSTEYPPDQHIPMHNEMSYTSSWPLRIWFFCAQPPLAGGETPIADSRKVLTRLSPGVRERFARHGILYQRNFGHELDLPWEEVFQTRDRAEVERFCRGAGLEYEWRPGDRLRTRQVCQAVARHPRSGEAVWFNQAHLFHITSLPAEVRAALLADLSEDELPRNTYYGDGSPIAEETLDEVREAFRQESMVFPWLKGDLLMLDNMLIAHGRTPFEGPRKILVGMAETVTAAECN